MAESFIGEIRMFGFNFAPKYWNFTEGQLLARSQNQALFSLLGTIYGGDGRTTFGLPDLRGRMPVGQGNGPGLSPKRLGQKSGQENVTLNVQQMPAHNHTISLSGNVSLKATTDTGNLAVPAKDAYLAKGEATVSDRSGDVTNYFSGTPTNTAELGGTSLSLNGLLGNTGGGQSFSIVNPLLALNFSIALTGLFPSRN